MPLNFNEAAGAALRAMRQMVTKEAPATIESQGNNASAGAFQSAAEDQSLIDVNSHNWIIGVNGLDDPELVL